MPEYKNDPNRITFLGLIDYRNKMVKFGIKAKDRTKHTYIIGKSGMGKSTLLENMAIQDIQNGEGLAFIDPHGGTAEKLLDFIPEERKKDVIYFAPFDTEYPLGLNVLEKVDEDKRYLVANGLLASFKKVFGEDKFSDRMQNILNNIFLALLENENETLIGVNRILSDKEYRKKIVSNVKDPSIKAFWTEEFAKAGEKYQQEAAPAIQNKIGQFTSNPLIRNIVGQKRTSFDIRDIMDNRKILIVNLSKGKVGEGNSNLIGSLLITKIYLAAMSRADVDPYKLNELPPFYFYVDEFQNFANDSFADILSEARKYQLALIVGHQYIDQLTLEVKSAIFGNVGTMITFRVGATDAEIFEREFSPVFSADDIVNLSAYQMYLRLMIDNIGSKPFSAKALPPIYKPELSFTEEILEHSRHRYGREKSTVENEIKDWYTPIVHIKEDKEQNINNFQDRNNYKHTQKENRENKIFEKNTYNTYTDKTNNHIRSKRNDYKKERDIQNIELKEIREEKEKIEKEFKENNTSLKDALAIALKDQKRRIDLSNKEDKEDKEETELKKEIKEEENTKKDKLEEVPEKVLRDLIDEE